MAENIALDRFLQEQARPHVSYYTRHGSREVVGDGRAGPAGPPSDARALGLTVKGDAAAEAERGRRDVVTLSCWLANIPRSIVTIHRAESVRATLDAL
jgi:hypothetical protein